jgi:hypothetical protein
MKNSLNFASVRRVSTTLRQVRAIRTMEGIYNNFLISFDFDSRSIGPKSRFAHSDERACLRNIRASTFNCHPDTLHHNTDPKLFVSQKTADQILDSVSAFCKRTDDSASAVAFR